MQTSFNTNFTLLENSLPSLYENFEFVYYENLPTVNSTGSGINFTPNIAFGRNYFGSNLGSIYNEGTGYNSGDICYILGTDLGGISPLNDCIITITTTNVYGNVLNYSTTGVTNYLQGQTYIQNGGSNQYNIGNYLNNEINSNINYGTGTIQNDVFGTGSNMVIDYNNSIFMMIVTNAYSNGLLYTSGTLGSNGNTDIGNTNNYFYIGCNSSINYGVSGKLQPGQNYNFSFASLFNGFTLSSNTSTDKVVDKNKLLNKLNDHKKSRSTLTRVPKQILSNSFVYKTPTSKRLFNVQAYKLPQDKLNYVTFSKKISLASNVDMRSKMQPIQDQGNLGSCTAFATTSLYGFLNPQYQSSQLFLYYNSRYLDYLSGGNSPTIDDGSTIYQSVKSSIKYGICNSSLWIYKDSNMPLKPTPACYTNAMNHQTITYKNVNQTIVDMKTCLNNGYPFMFGFLVYSSFVSNVVANTGIVPMPGRRERILGGHAVSCVGYNDTTQRLICRNSWGVSWGDSGYFYMPYAYMTNRNLCSDIWTITSIEKTSNNL